MKDIRLEPGDILICQGKSWLSRAIMKVTKGKWSHSALYTEVWGQPSIIEAQSNGVNYKLWGTWQAKYGYTYEVFRFNQSFDEAEVMARAFSKCGVTKYDFFTFLVKIPIRLLSNKSRFRKYKTKQDDRQICSEFTSYVWELPQKEITPQEQHDFLKGSSEWDLVLK